jgi:predicted nuclease of predicted toxin-antitoxin system
MPSRFKLDENLPRDAKALFQDAGHDVETVLDESLGGEPDSTLFDACQREERILVTLDLDFADIRQYPPEHHSGLWVLRPRSQSVGDVLALLRGGLNLHASESSVRRLWIIERGRVRIR